MKKVFCDELDFPYEMVKNLMIKYPVILGKSEEQIKDYFSTLKKVNVGRKTAMRSLVEVPKLISQDLDKQIKDIVFLFELYHNIS